MRTSASALLVLVCSATLLCPCAWAQSAPTKSAGQSRTVQTTWAGPDACARDPVCFDHAERARELSRIGQLDDALKEYQAAFGVQPMPRLAFNIARMQQKLGQLGDATRTYELYLNLGAEGDKEMAAKARSYLEEIYVITEPSPGPWVPPPPPPPSPVYKRWWFWTSIAVSVAVGATGIIVAARPVPTNPADVTIYRPFE